MPEEVDDALAGFALSLEQLRGRAARPSLSQLEKLTDLAGTRLPRSTLHEKLRGVSPPDWNFVSAFVHACVVHARSEGVELSPSDQDMELWRGAYGAMLQALAGERRAKRLARAAQQRLELTQTPTSVTTVPRQLPAGVETFSGRQKELHDLDTILLGVGGRRHNASIAAICGTAGVGKTALAVHWAILAGDRFTDGQLYVDLHGYDLEHPVTPGDALTYILRGLGLAGSDIAADVAARAAQYRSMVAERRLLLVLDNAKDSEHVRLLIPGSPLCRTLVTSRDRLGGLVATHDARRLEISPLTLASSVQLLNSLIGDRAFADATSTQRLANLCVGLPLALRVAAELVAHRTDASMNYLVAELAVREDRLGMLDVGDQRTAVREVLSWSFHHLDHAAARLLRLLSIQPGHDITAQAAGALVGIDERDALRSLQVLSRAHLVESRRSGRYSMHDLLRACAGEWARETERQLDEAVARIATYYVGLSKELVERMGRHPDNLADAKAMAKESKRRLREELPNIVALSTYCARHALSHISIGLSDILAEPLLVSAHYDEAATIHGAARTAARQLQDRHAEAVAHQHLSAVFRRWGSYDESLLHASKALRLCQEASNRPGQVNAHKSLGLLYQRQGRYDEAAEHHRQALSLAIALGDRLNEANMLGNLAIVYDLAGMFKPAVDQFERAVAVFQELGNRTGEGRALSNLAIVYEREGRHAVALRTHRQAMEIMRETGDRAGEGGSLEGIGLLYFKRHDYRQALLFLTQSLAVRQECGDRAGEGATFYGLGTVHERLDQLAEAQQHYELAHDIASELNDRHLRARALYGLAQIYRKGGKYQQASATYKQSKTLAADLGDRELKTRILDGLAQLMGALGEYQDARRYWTEALEFYTSRDMLTEAQSVQRRLARIENL